MIALFRRKKPPVEPQHFTPDESFDLLAAVCEHFQEHLRAFRGDDGACVTARDDQRKVILMRPVDLDAIRLAHGRDFGMIDALEQRVREIATEFQGVAELFDSPNWSLDA